MATDVDKPEKFPRIQQPALGRCCTILISPPFAQQKPASQECQCQKDQDEGQTAV